MAQRQKGFEVRQSLPCGHRAIDDPMRSFAVVDQQEQHVAIGPLGDWHAARLFDLVVDASDAGDCRGCLVVRTEKDPLSKAHGFKEALNRRSRQAVGKEQPIDSFDGGKLSSATGKEQQNGIWTAPDALDRRTGKGVR